MCKLWVESWQFARKLAIQFGSNRSLENSRITCEPLREFFCNDACPLMRAAKITEGMLVGFSTVTAVMLAKLKHIGTWVKDGEIYAPPLPSNLEDFLAELIEAIIYEEILWVDPEKEIFLD